MMRPGRLAAALSLVLGSCLGQALAAPAPGDAATKPSAPVVASTDPASGPTSGGTTVTVTGSDLTKVKRVLFGASAGTAVHSAGPTSLTVTAPAHAPGVVDVIVVTAAGRSVATSADRYMYSDATGPVAVVAPDPPGVTSNFIEMRGIACPGAGECEAIGRLNRPDMNDRPVVERWSQGTWTGVQPPLPADAVDADGAGLTDIACPAVDRCVAVGFYNGQSYTSGPSAYDLRPLIETWNGSSWSAASPPLPADAGSQDRHNLSAVSCASSTSCVAVGIYETSAGRAVPLAVSYDGTSWVSRGLNGGSASHGGLLVDVACPAPGACIAVGATLGTSASRPLVERLASGAWVASVAPLPADASARDGSAELDDLSCAAVSRCVAVGDYSVGKPAAQHAVGLAADIDATTIATHAVPAVLDGDPPHLDRLLSVSCWTTSDCLTGGFWYADPPRDSQSGTLSRISTSGGLATTDVPLGASTSTGTVDAVACNPGGACLGVGEPGLGHTSAGQVSVFDDGTATTGDAPAPPGFVHGGLYAVALDSPHTAAAVGDIFSDDYHLGRGLLVTGLALP